MSTVTGNKFSAGYLLHWVACLLGTGLVILFVILVIGNQPPLAVFLRPQMWALLLAMVGFLVAWRHDLLGGLMSVGGIGAFYLMNFEKAGNFPSGWVFPLFFVPAVLAVVAGLLRRRTAAKL